MLSKEKLELLKKLQHKELSKEKLELLKKLQHKEHTWSASLMTNGGCTIDMLSTESEIKSLRNQLKYQDVQENLAAAG
jgi:hypothetical protein